MRPVPSFAAIRTALAIPSPVHSQTRNHATFVTRPGEVNEAVERFRPDPDIGGTEGGYGAIRLRRDRTEEYVPFQVAGG